MDGFTEKILDVLLAIVIFVALFGVIVAQFAGVTWGALNVGGKVYDLSWAPFVIVIIIVVAVLVLVYQYMIKPKRK